MAKKQNTSYAQSFDIPVSLSDRNLQKILLFYLINCPVEGKSFRGKTFQYYGFSGSPAFSGLKTALLNSATKSLKKNYKPCKKTEIEEAFKEVEKISPPDEYCVYFCSEEKTRMQSLFSAIRNAFAHGSFNYKTYQGVRIFFLLNHDKYKKAQIVLHEDTLLAWIDIIEKGYNNLSK